MRLGVVLLAAGASSRMGRPKLLLPWGQTSVLGHHLSLWQRLAPGGQLAVVTPPGESAVVGELQRPGLPLSHRIENPTPESGMFGSIRCAARWGGWQPDLTHHAIVLGDQPAVCESTLRALLDFAAGRPAHICQPARSGRPRHPVIFPAEDFRALAHTCAATLKDYLEASGGGVALLASDDPGLDLDLDTPEDYERARAIARLPAGAIALLALVAAFATGALAQENAPRAAPLPATVTNALREVELRGRVVCLAEELHQKHGAVLGTRHEHLWGFAAEDGRLYTLLRTKYSEALFADETVRAKDLALKGRLFPGSQVFEPVTLRSVKHGRLHDLVYYCEVCAIDAVAPADCECCRAPTELVERPVGKP
jgi:molybdenum cofactor cytidylyltransferase